MSVRRRVFACVVVASTITLLPIATTQVAAAATPALVQIRSATPQTPQSTVALAYANAQVAGDTNIIAVG